MKHKHCDLIKAWADGADIQFQIYDKTWIDIKDPNWNSPVIFRIKPEPIKIKYRLFIYKRSDYIKKESHYTYNIRAADFDEAPIVEQYIGFVKWISDWQEYEVSSDS